MLVERVDRSRVSGEDGDVSEKKKSCHKPRKCTEDARIAVAG